MKEEPAENAKCKDKFLVQAVPVSRGMESATVSQIVRGAESQMLTDTLTSSSSSTKLLRVMWLSARSESSLSHRVPLRTRLTNPYVLRQEHEFDDKSELTLPSSSTKNPRPITPPAVTSKPLLLRRLSPMKPPPLPLPISPRKPTSSPPSVNPHPSSLTPDLPLPMLCLQVMK